MLGNSNGQQIAELNFQKFLTWLAGKSDNDFRQMVNRDGLLSRKEIVAECGFGSSAINQNPRIKAELLAKENELRERGVLPARSDKNTTNETVASALMGTALPKPLDTERLRRLEHENALLKTENQELKRQLEKFTLLHEALSTTGRLPR